MTYQLTQSIIDALAAAVNECDALMVQEQINNDHERSQGDRGYGRARLDRHSKRMKDLRVHRENLQVIYMAITGTDPWANIPY